MKRLVLIDGNAILHRAYHALPPLTTSKGALVNAVFGFCSMLLKVIHDLKPSYLVVCFDRPEPTFRHQIFKAYQAQRPKMEEELRPQLDLVKKVVKTMEIPIYEKAGYEADDIIGTLARQALKTPKRLDLEEVQPLKEVIIVTGDRDILQLVDENTKVYMPVKGLSLTKLYGEKEVKEKFGISPKQIVDFKALVGDQSDNYPGVKGIGPKTAAQLLKKCGSLEEIYDKINSFRRLLLRKGKKDHLGFFANERVFRALKQDKERAKLAKKLAKIVTDVPVTLDLKKARLGELNKSKVKKLFEKFEFKSLIPRLSDETSEPEAKIKKKEGSKQLSLI